MTPRQSFQTASDSSIAKGAVGILVVVALGLGGWTLNATADNAGAISDEKTDRIQSDGDIKERLARIETNTDLILKKVSTP